MNLPIVGEMIIAPLHGHRLHAAIAHEKGTGQETGLRSGSTGEGCGAHVRHMDEIEGTEAQALEAARHMMMMRTYLFPGESGEMCRTFRYLFWRS
jgi:hypothetical protein